ncbi:MAG: hypothetical protein HY040_25165 [Planctomycetes bacterium]|nr:hypothetical protein [Planctomycetota bacterium]
MNSAWTKEDRRVGMWSALSVAIIGVVYFLTGLVWLVTGGSSTPQPLEPAEPYLSILELLILLSAPILIALMAAVHSYAAPDRKTCALAALALMTAFAVLTGGVHFVQLVVARRLPETALEQSVMRLYPWPSIALALDLLAWDVFLGLALVFAGLVFTGGAGLQKAVWAATTLSGALCVAGSLGPLLGQMRLQFLAISGYAVVLPVACALMGILFSRTRE